MRLNLGSGQEPLPEWTNVDLRPPADIVGDFTMMEFTEVDQILMSHVLEHISWRRTQEVLCLVRSWMRAGSTLTVEVPDIERVLELGADYRNWQLWLYGDQRHEGEQHLAGFTQKSLTRELRRAGFKIPRKAARVFLSGVKGREGYPCLEVRAVAA